MRHWRFDGILAWVMVTGIALVVLTIAMVNLLDRLVIEQTAAQNLHAASLRVAGAVSRIVGKGGDIHNVEVLREAFQDILELRPLIRRLEVFDISPDSSTLILSSDPRAIPGSIGEVERAQLAAGRSLKHLDDSILDRAWLITAPIVVDGRVVGALRGRFSLWRYDRLIEQEGKLAKDVGIAAVSLTCLVFIVLVRVKFHRPISRLLYAMRGAEAGDLTSQAPLVGPSDIQEVASQFNRMLNRVRETIAEREHLLDEIQSFNDTLMTKISEATEELHRTNATLVETRSQAERAEKLAALGELSAMVAHELGNPLNAMSGHLQMLAKASHHKDRERHLTVIRSEIDRMVGIIQHVLDSTRVQVQSVPVDLNEVIDEVLTLISPALPGRRIAVKTDLALHLSPVAGDRRALHGMLFNLATNAIHAMPKGGELDIKTCQTMNKGVEGNVVLGGDTDLSFGAIRLTVRDTGQGIPPEYLGSIFKPFFTTRHGEGGTGLGLAICHRVVSASGGRLAVQSAVGHGTLFTIDLPIWREASLREEANGP